MVKTTVNLSGPGTVCPAFVRRLRYDVRMNRMKTIDNPYAAGIQFNEGI